MFSLLPPSGRNVGPLSTYLRRYHHVGRLYHEGRKSTVIPSSFSLRSDSQYHSPIAIPCLLTPRRAHIIVLHQDYICQNEFAVKRIFKAVCKQQISSYTVLLAVTCDVPLHVSCRNRDSNPLLSKFNKNARPRHSTKKGYLFSCCVQDNGHY